MADPSPPPNPDTRPLPKGWVQEWERSAQRWIYVRKNVYPEVASWVHPLGPPPDPPVKKEEVDPPVKKEEEE